MADTVTMAASHYETLTKKAHGHKEAGMYGEWGLTLAKRNKQAFTTILAGALGWYLVSNKTWSDKIALFKDHWWLKPLLVLVAGWYLWRRQNPYATIVLALGAALFAQAWKTEQNKKNPPGTESGDAGAPYDWDAAAGEWVKSGTGTPDMVMGKGNTQSERFADQVFGQRAA